MSLKKLREESYNKEAILVGMMWNNPDLYGLYSAEVLNKNTMGNTIWSFYLGLGRNLYNKGLTVFDDISVQNEVVSLKLEDRYEKYGGYQTIEELMEETKGKESNFEAYYEEVKKYALLREYYKLFGDKVISNSDEKYNYKNMTRQMISVYWNDKLNNIDIENNDTQIVAYNLLDDLEKFIEQLDINPDIGMPFHKAYRMTEMINGWDFGTVSILGSFSGNGKTSFTTEKIILACIENNEKLAIIANEQDLSQYRKLLLITIMGTELYNKFKKFHKNIRFNRKNINKGNFTNEEKEKLKMAVEWVNEVTGRKSGEKNPLIKFIPLEDYTMENVKKAIKKYANRGYRRWIIDTAKPSEGGNKERWQQFVEDFDVIYKLARKDGGGLNLAIFCTIQLADTFKNKYWLDEQSIADGKKIKNVVDLVWHMRPAHPTEYEGGEKEIDILTYTPLDKYLERDDFNDEESVREQKEIIEIDGKEYIKEKIKLDKKKVYYLLFTSKNRRGQSNITGLDVLVFEVDFNGNRWKEIGYTSNVYRDDVA